MAEPFPINQRVRVTTRDAEAFGYQRGDLGTVDLIIEPSGPRVIHCYDVVMDRGGRCTFNHLELIPVEASLG